MTGDLRDWRVVVTAISSPVCEVQRPSGERVELAAVRVVLGACVGEPPVTWAAADALFETLHVSREVSSDEADALRRVMAGHVRPPVKEPKPYTVTMLPGTLQALSEELVKQRAESIREWLLPRSEATSFKRGEPDMTAFHGRDRVQQWSRGKAVEPTQFVLNARPPRAPKRPRVPQVGDEVEVLHERTLTWCRARVRRIEPYADGHCFFHADFDDVGRGWTAMRDSRAGVDWRWPNTKSDRHKGTLTVGPFTMCMHDGRWFGLLNWPELQLAVRAEMEPGGNTVTLERDIASPDARYPMYVYGETYENLESEVQRVVDAWVAEARGAR